MNANHIQTKFEKLGARAKFRPLVRNRWGSAPGPMVIDIGHDRHGEFFDIQAPDVKVNEKMIYTSEPISRARFRTWQPSLEALELVSGVPR